MNVLMVVGNVILLAAAIPATLFVVFYSRVKWERTQIGRQTMALSLVMAVTLDLVLFRTIIGESVWYTLIRLTVFALIIPTLWWRLFLLVQAQRTGVVSTRYLGAEEERMEPRSDALEGDLGTLGDEEYFDHLARAKREDFHGVDPDGNRYEPDEKVQDLRAEKA